MSSKRTNLSNSLLASTKCINVVLYEASLRSRRLVRAGEERASFGNAWPNGYDYKCVFDRKTFGLIPIGQSRWRK